ncbi:hypothetical protein AGRO_3694 [Agrobacterium sp. ATCC 31749]|uniref:hypothetical protein n=1 Tax=unclassified Agrobacterium TaxID=2632611 RepID=UPI00020DB752|nr:MULTISPECIES: hypothetical protein [unclassified Agrobacterium]EGL63625.1 hypothetical protein AGRO_3694 [Agrobacterium sp. ATCC 31749]QKW97067.1 hypothetical protein GSF67_08195 [Agrobacterium sp. CGMCC 11546]
MSLKHDVRDARLFFQRASVSFDRHRGAVEHMSAAISSTVTLLLTLTVASAASLAGLL